MKKIERYLNFLYWGIERKVRFIEYGSWSVKYVPRMSVVASSFYVGLILLFFFDLIESVAIMSWYFASRTEYHPLIRDIFMTDLWNQFIAFIAFVPSIIVTYIFVLRKNKYKNYYKQFEKLSEDMQSTWSYMAILFFVFGFMIIWFLGKFRAMYIPQ